MKKSLVILFAMVIGLFPLAAFADGLIPAINAYNHTPGFYFIFAGVVLIESLCLRLWLPQVGFPSVLWRVVLLNSASSFAGWLLMHSPMRPDFPGVLEQAIPFFFLTLGVELPLLLLLFRFVPTSWRRKLLAGTVANMLSYVFLIAAYRPTEAMWLSRLWTADRRKLDQWTNTQMLAQTTGVIYGTESPQGLPHRLRCFDPRVGQWHSVTNCPPIHPGLWDVEGDLVAFKHYQEKGYAPNDITIRRLPDFARVTEISVPNAMTSDSGWGLKISPDKTKLAVLVPRHEMSAPLRGDSRLVFGRTCDLVVYEAASGAVLATSPRKALFGLCWLPDSRHVLFRSLRDPTLHDVTSLEEGWERKSPGADRMFSDAPMYAYDIESGSVDYFGAMKSIHLATGSGQLVYKVESDGVCVLDPASGQSLKTQIDPLGYGDVVACPDGRFAIVHITLTNPMAYVGYPVIVDLRNPTQRHYLEGFDYKFVWTTEVQQSDAAKRPRDGVSQEIPAPLK